MGSRSSATSNRIWTPDRVRERIRVTKLVQVLELHALGKIEMSATRIRAAEVVLRKALPDLTAVEHSGFIETPPTRDQILERLAHIHGRAVERLEHGGANGSAQPDDSAPSTH
jgi:hypothetical protein